MLKVKKIRESVIPKTTVVSEEEKQVVKLNADDGAVYYEATYNAEAFHCLRCGENFALSGEGTIQCPKCGNKKIRQRRYNCDCSCYYIRFVEVIDGFLVIKDSAVKADETMTGIEVYSYDIACVVVQPDGEVGAFDNCRQGYDERGVRIWTRVKRPATVYLRNQKKQQCRIQGQTVPEHPLFKLIESDIYTMGLCDLYNKLKMQGTVVGKEEVKRPVFDESLVSYDLENAKKLHTVVIEKEYSVNNSEANRIHGWCTKCGKYYQRLTVGNYTYRDHTCALCGMSVSELGGAIESVNYFVTPQEYEDGTMMIRIDEGYYKAHLLGEQVRGVDPEVTFDLEIKRVIYVYVTLDGKATFFNDAGETVDKLGIPVNINTRWGENVYICSKENRQLIMNNKAVKRTGFVEYCDRKAKIDMRYFEALSKIPSLEMISKMGMNILVEDLIYADDKDIPGYLKKDDKGLGLKRLTKPQMQSLINGDCHLSYFVPYMQVLKKDGEALFADFQWLASGSHFRHVLDILRVKIPNMTVKKIREYLEHVDEAQCCRVGESAQLWADYLRMLRDLECDLTDKQLIYPNSLKREHDKAARKITQVKDEKLNQVFRERAEKNDKYAWENENFKVLIPHDISELYEEGRKLSHCVGTYGKVVAEGKSVVAFIRKASDVNTPLCTIEIRQNTIVQARGMSNRPAENIPNMRTFIKAWAKNKGLQYAA